MCVLGLLSKPHQNSNTGLFEQRVCTHTNYQLRDFSSSPLGGIKYTEKEKDKHWQMKTCERKDSTNVAS